MTKPKFKTVTEFFYKREYDKIVGVYHEYLEIFPIIAGQHFFEFDKSKNNWEYINLEKYTKYIDGFTDDLVNKELKSIEPETLVAKKIPPLEEENMDKEGRKTVNFWGELDLDNIKIAILDKLVESIIKDLFKSEKIQAEAESDIQKLLQKKAKVMDTPEYNSFVKKENLTKEDVNQIYQTIKNVFEE